VPEAMTWTLAAQSFQHSDGFVETADTGLDFPELLPEHPYDIDTGWHAE